MHCSHHGFYKIQTVTPILVYAVLAGYICMRMHKVYIYECDRSIVTVERHTNCNDRYLDSREVARYCREPSAGRNCNWHRYGV